MSIPSASQLKKAALLAEKIEELQRELASIMGSKSTDTSTAEKPRKKRGRPPMTAEAKEKIAAAQRQRWAKSKGVNS